MIPAITASNEKQAERFAFLQRDRYGVDFVWRRVRRGLWTIYPDYS
jgi:hypothetical protein